MNRKFGSLVRPNRKGVRQFRPALERLEDRLTPSTLLSGFSETRITSVGLTNPTAMEFSPTNELWILEQTGTAKLVRNDGTTHPALSLTVDSSGERGLLGIAFDPTYDGAGSNLDRIYLYYTVSRQSSTNPAHNRLSRFTVTAAGTTTPALGSEVVLLDLPPEDEDGNLSTDGDTNHNGGAIHFGPDGKLYVAVGDHNYDTVPQSSHVSQVLTSPFGKILRLNPDGTNPTDNPFYDGNARSVRGSIWALGLRNPYTFAFQPGGTLLYINDVGESEWEEINRGEARANYGWAGSTSPLWEGFESPAPSWANYRDPVMAYDHSSASGAPAGCAITGGVFYAATSQFGSAYAGKYFFADFCGNFIRVFDSANPGSVTNPDTSAAFAGSLTFGSAVDLKVDADGSFYFLARGGGGGVFKIQFQAPTITGQPANTTVNPGQNATFTVSATSTGALTYQWQKLIGNHWTDVVNGARVSGATTATLTITNAQASDAGTYRALVRNFNRASTASNAATLTVTAVAGGTAPGLKAEFFDYTTELSALPDLTGRTAEVVRTDAQINYAPTTGTWPGLSANMADTFGARHTGLLRISTAGSYTFYLDSNDGSKLWLDGQLVIDNDGLHNMTEVSGTRTLTVGDHSLRVEFFENLGTAGLILSWAGPGFAKQVVPASVLFQSQNPSSFQQDSGPDGLAELDDSISLANSVQSLLNSTAAVAFWIRTTQVGHDTLGLAPAVLGVQAGDVLGAKSTYPIHDDQWHDVDLTRDAATGWVQVYVDGVLTNTATSAAAVVRTPFRSLSRVANPGGPLQYLRSDLDELRFYDRVLTAAEIQALAQV